jgi:DNA-binding CsgD family transcriptional regulator
MLERGVIMEDPVEAAAKATMDVCALPAVATHDWCDRAAAALLGIRRGAIVLLGLAPGEEEDALREPPIVGAAADCDALLDDLRRRIIPSGGPSWRSDLECGSREPGVARLSVEDVIGRGRRLQPAGSWERLGVRSMLVGCAALTPEPADRHLVVELGLRSEPGFVESDETVLRAVLTPLARKARMAFGSANAARANAPLTAREQEVLERLTIGMSVKQIAADLMRSPHTVHDHVKALHRKLNASSRGQLIARALGHIGAEDEATSEAACAVRT